jgi:hypothetical protein
VSYWTSKGLSVGALAISWAVNSFVIVLLFGIALGFAKIGSMTFVRALICVGAFSVIVHGSVIWYFSWSKKWRASQTVGDSDGLKLLEYTISVVCWTLQAVLWWYGASDAAFVFTFIPTYFVTSLLVFHEGFRHLAGLGIRRKTLLVLVGNVWTLSHAIITVLKARAALGAG